MHDRSLVLRRGLLRIHGLLINVTFFTAETFCFTAGNGDLFLCIGDLFLTTLLLELRDEIVPPSTSVRRHPLVTLLKGLKAWVAQETCRRYEGLQRDWVFRSLRTETYPRGLSRPVRRPDPECGDRHPHHRRDRHSGHAFAQCMERHTRRLLGQADVLGELLEHGHEEVVRRARKQANDQQEESDHCGSFHFEGNSCEQQ